ncbi:MAG: carboxypeptidase regulatory-like domain-containing protein [Acidobacteria bacterium]|nr:carboxypeptidase regulatory-like domain-containing protein [Acidobacteriota bacterium]
MAGAVIGQSDGHALARARVVLTDVKNGEKSQTTFSREDGSFTFTAVPEGKYSLQATMRGFLSSAYDQHEEFSTAIVTGAGVDTKNLTLRLSPAGVIAGKIFDENGEPVRHAQVSLFRVIHTLGSNEVRRVYSEQNNDLGAYEFTRLASGSYYIAVQATPWYAVHPQRSNGAQFDQVDGRLNVAYPITYCGDSTSADAATPISLAPGAHIDCDIHLKPVPALRLTVHLTDALPNVGLQLGQEGPDREVATAFVPETRVERVAADVWQISGIPAGSYRLLVPGQTGGLGQSAPVEIVNDGQQVEASSELSRLKVSAQLLGDKTLPHDLTVFLRSEGGIVRSGQALGEDEQTRPLEVAPGRYEVMVGGGNKAYSIVHMSGSGCEVSGHMVDVPAGSATLALTVVRGAARVEGVVQRNGRPLAGAMVVLVPDDPVGKRTLFRRDQSDLDGSFALNSVVPGGYTAVAIEDGWDLNWSEPAVISAYSKRGVAVKVRDGETGLIRLSQLLEAQSK